MYNMVLHLPRDTPLSGPMNPNSILQLRQTHKSCKGMSMALLLYAGRARRRICHVSTSAGRPYCWCVHPSSRCVMDRVTFCNQFKNLGTSHHPFLHQAFRLDSKCSLHMTPSSPLGSMAGEAFPPQPLIWLVQVSSAIYRLYMCGHLCFADLACQWLLLIWYTTEMVWFYS
jgi:hypothetical protein